MDVTNLLITDRQKIIEKMGKSREEADKDIDIIIDWFQTQKHLPQVLSRNAIERTLAITKFSIERTKQLCDMYYTARKLIPQVFDYVNPALKEQKPYYEKVMYYFPLQQLTEDLCRINVISYRDFELPEYTPNNFLAHAQIVFEVMLQEEMSMGDIIIVDFKHMKNSYVLKSTPVNLKIIIFFLEKIWASRVKGLHFINVPTYAEILITLAKSILKKKILDRTFIHDSVEKLYEHMPRELLPKDFGGQGKTLDEINELWKQKFQQYSTFFEKLQKMEVNESLRPEPLVNSDILGFYGNFKKIDVD